MKKTLNILLMVMAVSAVFATSVDAAILPKKQYQANVQTKRLSKGTTLKLQLLDPASTDNSAQGDMFQGMLVEDKINEDIMILPKGTIFRGTIDNIIPSKRVSQGAVLYMSLDHVVTPTGRQLPVNANLTSNGIVLTVDGGIKAGGNYGYALQRNWDNVENILENCIDWGIAVGDKSLGGWAKYITIPFASVGGVVGGLGYYVGDAIVDLFKKGGEVTFHQGSEVTFILMDDVDIPVH